MARFIRDEKRTYPLMWLVVGGALPESAMNAVHKSLVDVAMILAEPPVEETPPPKFRPPDLPQITA